MIKESGVVPVAVDKDPILSSRGGWLANQYVNSIARMYNMPSADTVIKEIHRRLLWEQVVPNMRDRFLGVYRTYDIMGIVGTGVEVPPGRQVEVKMREYVKKIDRSLPRHPTKYLDPKNILLLGSIAHYELTKNHPFFDGNGRVARFLVNLINKRHGFKVIIIPPTHRAEYLDSLENVTQSGRFEHLAIFLGSMLKNQYSQTNTIDAPIRMKIGAAVTSLVNDLHR